MAKEKLGWHRCIWCDLIAIIMHVLLVLYYGYVACCFNSFSFIFAISWIITFFKTTRDMLFQCFVQRLCSVFEHVVLLEENMGRNPEFYYSRFELADMDNSECKANFIFKKTWSARISWCSASPWKILLFSETKKENHKDVHRQGISTIKEKLPSHLMLIWLFCRNRVFHCLLHTFSFCVQLTKENYTFLDQWNWIVDFSVNSRKLQKYFQQYI